MTLLAHEPRLVAGERVVWRLDVDLSLPSFGRVATLGTIDVDTESGAVIPLTETQIKAIMKTANALAARLSSHTATGS